MVNAYRWFLAVPVLILLLSFYILLAGEASIGKANEREREPPGSANAEVIGRSTKNDPVPATVYVDNIKINRESAYPYFLLGTGLLVVLLILPRLGELSFNPTGGFTLKILNEARAAINEAKATAQAVEAKSKQAFKTNAPESLIGFSPDLTSEIKKLEESNVRLNTYAAMLEKLYERKGKL